MGSFYQVIYDEQCEVCQAGVSWLKVLDHGRRIVIHPIDPNTISKIHPDLNVEACSRELHVLTPEGKIVVGADAVILLARLFPETRLIGIITGAPGMRAISRILYRFVALNRYALSKCRGGACHVVSRDVLIKRSGLGAFWSCYSIGMVMRLPLSITTALRDAAERIKRYVFTFRRRIDLLDGRLQLLFLGGIPCDVVPLVFGEQFWTVIYDGAAIDPGSPKMLSSLRRHLRNLPPDEIRSVVATHHHEEYVGNLNWPAHVTGAEVYVPAGTAGILAKGLELPWARRFIIGTPPKLGPPFEILRTQLPTKTGSIVALIAVSAVWLPPSLRRGNES